MVRDWQSGLVRVAWNLNPHPQNQWVRYPSRLRRLVGIGRTSKVRNFCIEFGGWKTLPAVSRSFLKFTVLGSVR